MIDFRMFSLLNQLIKPRRKFEYKYQYSIEDFRCLLKSLLGRKVKSVMGLGGKLNLFSGEISKNKFVLRTDYNLVKEYEVPVFEIKGNVMALNDQECNIKVLYDIKNGSKIYMVILLIPISVLLFALLNKAFLYLLPAVIIYIILDVIFLLYSLQTIKKTKLYFEEFLEL